MASRLFDDIHNPRLSSLMKDEVLAALPVVPDGSGGGYSASGAYHSHALDYEGLVGEPVEAIASDHVMPVRHLNRITRKSEAKPPKRGRRHGRSRS